MRIVRITFVSASVLIMALCMSASVRHSTVMLQSMQLLTPEVGWASTNHQLFWTSNGGRQWTEITPRRASSQEIAAVFFRGTSTAWVLLFDRSRAQFDLASTANSGTSWSVNRVIIAGFDPKSMSLAGGGRIDFVDSTNGWMNLDLVSSSNFRLGILLATQDGGRTWNWTPKSPGVAGDIHFLNTKEGWLAGGPGGQKLYVTRDGSNSWQELSLKAPPEVYPAVYPTYGLPVFEESSRGFLPVTYVGGEGVRPALVLFATKDGGQTWRPERVLPNLDETSIGVTLPTVVVKSSLISAAVSNRTHLTLTTVTPSGRSASPSREVVSPGSAVWKLSFVDPTRGWVLVAGGDKSQLLATTDAGATWADITPDAKPTAAASPEGPLGNPGSLLASEGDAGGQC